MATSLSQHVFIDSCNRCGKQYKSKDSPRDGHCSHDCFYKDRGEGALNQIASDHRICATCFRLIKSVSNPDESYIQDRKDWRRIIMDYGGDLYGDSDFDKVLDATDVTTSTRITASESIIGFQYPTEHTEYLHANSGRWMCQCGAVDTNNREDILASLELETTIAMLLARLTELAQSGAISDTPNTETFVDVFDPQELNWEYAIGKALYE